MRAIRVHEYGGPEALRLDDIPVPEPGPGEARVKIAAAGVNFIDIYHRSGQYKGYFAHDPRHGSRRNCGRRRSRRQ